MNFISDDQVRGAISLPQAIDVLEQAFRELGRGEAANLSRTRAVAGGVTLSTMGAVMAATGVLGAKVYPTIDGRFNFCINLFSARDGRLLAVVEGNALTELRTAAGTLLAARYLAAPAPRTLALFGSGIQARAHAHALVGQMQLAQVLVVDAHGRPQVLADELGQRFGVAARCVASPAEALAQADVVVTATRSKEPLFDADGVRPGTFIAAIGSSKPDAQELPAALLARAACVAVESRAQALAESGDFVRAGTAVAQARIHELGELVAGTAGYTRGQGDITVYKSVGIGLEDVALAAAALARLKA